MAERSRQTGFTVGEIMAALAVVGISLAVAVPSMQSLSGNNRRAVAVNQLVSTMHLARGEAVMRNQSVTICASMNGESCAARSWEEGWIAFIDGNANGQHDSGETIIDRVTGLTGLSLDSVQFENALTYRPDGRAMGETPEANSGEFAFCETGAESATRVVIVRANGLPALSDKSRNGAPARCPAD